MRIALLLFVSLLLACPSAEAKHDVNKQMIFTYEHLHSEEKNDWPGSDEPYVLIWIADLHGAFPRTRLYHFQHGDSVDPGETHLANLRLWNLDGSGAPIAEPDRLIVLVAVLEKDDLGEGAIVEFIRAAINPLELVNKINNYGWSAQTRQVIVEELRQSMRNVINGVIDVPIANSDDFIGDVLEFPITSQFVETAQKNGSATGELWFKSSGFYKLRFRMNTSSENSPPAGKILEPGDGASPQPGGLNFVTFRVAVNDFEDGENCCGVRWTSDVDGYMGVGKKIQFAFTTAGKRTVTATVTDSEGAATKMTVIVNVSGNTPPNVTIRRPGRNHTIYRGVPFTLEGATYDPNESFQTLPCSALTWSSSLASDRMQLIGCTPQVTFATPGPRTITLTGKDSFGQSAQASIAVNVLNPAAAGALVTIDSLSDGDHKLGTSVIPLSATATELAGGQVLSYQWVVRYGAVQKVIASGTALSGKQFTVQWKPQDHVQPLACGSKTVTLQLSVTGASGAASADAEIYLDVIC